MAKKNREWQVDVLNQHSGYEVRSDVVKRLLKRGLEIIPTSHVAKSIHEIDIVFTDDKEIKKLNSAYRAKNKPTDVLSFSQTEGEDLDFIESLGDIIISLDTAKKQAKQYKVTFEEEVLRLLMHGMLHLLGYDHVDVPEEVAEEMRAREDELQAALGKSWRKPWILGH